MILIQTAYTVIFKETRSSSEDVQMIGFERGSGNNIEVSVLHVKVKGFTPVEWQKVANSGII